jgi:hypothetical protein
MQKNTRRAKNRLKVWHLKRMARIRFDWVGLFSRRGFFPHNIIITSSRFLPHSTSYATVLGGPQKWPTSPLDPWSLHRNDVTFYAYQPEMMLLFMLIRVCQCALLCLSECAKNLKLVLLKTTSFFNAVCLVRFLAPAKIPNVMF